MKNTIERKYIDRSMNYKEYRDLIDELLEQGKTTGQQQSDDLSAYARLNVARMKRLEKNTEINEELTELVKSINQPVTWLILTEGWCGDAAQIVPVLHAIAELNKTIDFRILLRDENLELMDRYLTNGKSRSIPKLIVLNSDTLEEIFNWGPRPYQLQEIIKVMSGSDTPKETIKETIHAWYAKDKTFHIQLEIMNRLKEHKDEMIQKS